MLDLETRRFTSTPRAPSRTAYMPRSSLRESRRTFSRRKRSLALLGAFLATYLFSMPVHAQNLNDQWMQAFQQCSGGPCLNVQLAQATGPLTGSNTLNDVMLQAFQTCGSTPCLRLTLGTGSAPWTVAAGGTGAGTFAAHGVIVGEGTSPFVAVGPGASNSVLTGQGASADPSFSTSPTLTTLTATNALRTTGALAANFAGAALDYSGGVARVFAQGVDASTSGRFQLFQMRSDGTSSLNILLTDASGNITLGPATADVTIARDLYPGRDVYATRDIWSGRSLNAPKMTALGTAPGAGYCRFEVVTGTNAGTCKLQAVCGTSSTAVTVIDNVGSGC
jgi:hypothetical protein